MHRSIRAALPTLAAILLGLAIGAAVLVFVYYPAQHDAVAECASAPKPFDCLKAQVVAVADDKGPVAALQLLAAKVENNPQLQTWCHPLTHEVGHEGFEREGDIGRAFSLGDGTCASGYYHGVMEAAVSSVPRTEIAVRAESFCASLKSNPPTLSYYNCVHGMRHGFSAVFHDDWRAALGGCSALTGEWEQSSCASGVFMQNVVNEYQNVGHKSDFKADDPLYPCTAAEERWGVACYLNQSSHVLYRSGGDFAPVFAACATAPYAFRSICFQSAGRDTTGRFRTDPARVVSTCAGAGEHEGDCLIGAAKDDAYHYGRPNEALKLCSLAPAAVRVSCDAAAREDIGRATE